MVKRAWPPVRVELSDLSLFYQALLYGNLPSVKLLSPQVSGSMITFMTWKYRGEIRDLLSASIREVPVVGETSPKRITWSNVYRSFPLQVLIFIKFWDKLEALSVYVSFFCPFFTVEVLKHGILDSVPALQNYLLSSAESSCSLEYVVLVAGACSRAFVAPGCFSCSIWVMLGLSHHTVAPSSWFNKMPRARIIMSFSVCLFVLAPWSTMNMAFSSMYLSEIMLQIED